MTPKSRAGGYPCSAGSVSTSAREVWCPCRSPQVRSVGTCGAVHCQPSQRTRRNENAVDARSAVRAAVRFGRNACGQAPRSLEVSTWLAPPTPNEGLPQGMRVSSCSPAVRFSSSVRSDRLTGVTSDQCAPTGQRWNLHQPNRTDFEGHARNPDRREQMTGTAPDDHIATERVAAEPQHARLRQDGHSRYEQAAHPRPRTSPPALNDRLHVPTVHPRLGVSEDMVTSTRTSAFSRCAVLLSAAGRPRSCRCLGDDTRT